VELKSAETVINKKSCVKTAPRGYKMLGCKKLNTFIYLLGLFFLLSSCTRASTGATDPEDFKITLRLSHVFSPNEELTHAMDIVAKRVQEKTEGAVRILTFPQGQIATYKDGVELVRRGAYFISVEDPSYIGDYVPEFTALVGPMLYQNYDEYLKLVDTPLVQGWKKKLEDKAGIKVLSLKYIFGFRNVISNKVVRTPQDLRGVKLRTPGSKLFIQTINAMGATATPLPWGETFSALQQGVVDGLEGSEFTNLGTKVYETGKKNVALTNHFLGVCGVYISTDVWSKIPEKYRHIIEEEFVYGADEMNNLLKAKHAEVIAELKTHGVEFNDIDRSAFEKETVKLFDELPGVNRQMYNDIHERLKSIREASKL
jgi:TRAP-type C4-dicarboxylate transport system substrate-binding protein